jgi:hypothetical protein
MGVRGLGGRITAARTPIRRKGEPGGPAYAVIAVGCGRDSYLRRDCCHVRGEPIEQRAATLRATAPIDERENEPTAVAVLVVDDDER